MDLADLHSNLSRPPSRGRFRPSWLPFLALLATAAGGPAAAQSRTPSVFLVRHAEKAPEPASDPGLTPEGRRRASELATLLADAGIDAVWSTDYERTRATAAPLARRLGLQVRLYDPGDLESLAERLRDGSRRSLVVGHSNTTPALVALLGGEPGPPIDETTEYDRLYVLTLTDGGAVTTLLRYGTPRPGG